MTRLRRLFVALMVFYCASSPALSEPKNQTWLMQGNVLTDEHVASQFLQLDSYRKYDWVMGNRIFKIVWEYKIITCVILASVHLKGRVSIVEGGYNSNTVAVEYDTENDELEEFYIFVQTAELMKRNTDHLLSSSSPSVQWMHYVNERNRIQKELQDALRNISLTFFSS